MTHVIGKVRRRVRRAMPAGVRGGGEAVRRALRSGTLQAILQVGAQKDAYEREADAVAAQVMAGQGHAAVAAALTAPVQRMCADCEEEAQRAPMLQRETMPEEDEETLQSKAQGEALQRPSKPEEEEESLQAKSEVRGGFTASAGVSAQVSGLRGGGQPLPGVVRSFFEPRFGANFSDVRIHTGAPAEKAAQSLRARAFTTGRDVVFNKGEYAPGTVRGGTLMAHELTHVIQQRGYKRTPEGKGNGPVQRWVVGGAPVPEAGLSVAPAAHLPRLNAAEDIVRGVVADRNCRNFFRDNCQNGAGAAALQNAFDNTQVYFRDVDNTTFGLNTVGSNVVSYNRRAFRIGRWMLASTILHEMFHTCDPVVDANDELMAENAVETCRVHTPLLRTMSPGSGPVGTQVTITGLGFGPTQGPSDRVEINGVSCPVVSWAFGSGRSSGITIVVEIPAGAASGPIQVINNNVRSNPRHFTVT